MSPSADSLLVATRTSPLALAQVAEIRAALQTYAPHITLIATPMTARGDLDLATSLRMLAKDDFFTRELDLAVASGHCRIAIHAAKDLPDPLPEGLQIVALTRGLDNGDSVVLPDGLSLYDLPAGASIATSSERREAAVQALRSDLTFCDVRGLIHQRLALLDNGAAAGVVIAEAALQRLGLTHRNRMRLPGPATPLQGRLAIVARQGDHAMVELFRPLHCAEDLRPYCQLHVGITPPPAPTLDCHVLHCPFITTLPRPYNDQLLTDLSTQLTSFTHYLFTSKCAVHYFAALMTHHSYAASTFCAKVFLAVGEGTADTVRSSGLCAQPLIAPVATAEGMCALLDTLDLSDARLLWPHSALARRVIATYLTKRQANWQEAILYTTETQAPATLPDLSTVDEIVFTSPSTLDAFCQLYGPLPHDKALRCIGPITAAYLRDLLAAQRSARV